MEKYAGLAGIVLAGGRSSRLGLDKDRLSLGGEDMLTRTARLLSSFLSRVVGIGRRHGTLESRLDDEPGTGPVGAVTTALRHTRTSCLVLPCDLPFMNEPTLAALLNAWERRPEGTLQTAFLNSETGFKENLVAVYEYEALQYFEPRLKERKLKISLIVPQEMHHYIAYAPDDSLPFFSINHSADLQAARRIFAMERGKV